MRLLLAEDEKALSRALVAILERSNYSVDAVFDGQSALDYLQSENYDGVILDVMMPKMDGFTVLKNLREAGNLVPVLLLTAKSEIDDKVFGLDLGANDYLTKPFNSRELLARVRAMTRTQVAQPDKALQLPGAAGTGAGHDANPGGAGRRPAAHGKRDAGPGHTGTLYAVRQFPAGQQRISGDGTFDEQPAPADSHGTLS